MWNPFAKRKREQRAASPGPTERAEPKKVLVVTDVGGWPNSQVTVVGWNELARVQNIRDYDDIVLDVTAAPGVPAHSFQSVDPSTVLHWQGFVRAFDHHVVDEFLAIGGNLVVVGDASIWRTAPGLGGGWTSSTARTDFTNFLRLEFAWESAPGTRTELADGVNVTKLGSYLNRLSGYEVALNWVKPYQNAFSFDSATRRQIIAVEVKPYAATRTGKPIAFSLRRITMAGPHDEPLAQVGEVVFLPIVPGDRREALRILLSDFVGLDLTDQAPPWVSDMKVVAEFAIDNELGALRGQIDQISWRMNEANERRQLARRPLRLLYEMNQELEEAVYEALRDLGATVEAPDDPSKEDGWVEVTVDGRIYYGVLEIKGTGSDHFGAKGLRQLGEWVQRGKKLKGIDCKPIFIGSNKVRAPLGDRPDPFVHDVIQTATQFGACLLRGEDLFRALEADRRGELDRDKFWKTVFETLGRADFQYLKESA